MHPGQRLCGAKKRNGDPCRTIAMANGRCRIHGGKSTGPKNPKANPGNKKHGIYSHYYTDEEKDLNLREKIGDLTEEIELVRVRIIRITQQMVDWDNAQKTKNDDVIESFSELVEVSRTTGEKAVGDSIVPIEQETKVRKRPDFEAMLQRYMARLESLEKTHKELQGTAQGGTAEEKAREILDTVAEMDATIPDPDEEE